MLKGISPLISPELLMILSSMGHGDELALTDAHFPADSFNPTVIRADGLGVDVLLDGILPLFEIDSYVDDPIVMMLAAEGDELDPRVEERFMVPIKKHAPDAPAIVKMERFSFYERAQTAFAIVCTGELAKYGNIIIKKGVTPCE